MAGKHQLGVVDYVVVGISLLIAAFIGIWFRITRNRQNTHKEYLMAGKDMSRIPVILSTSVTMLSATTMIGIPAEIYRFGFTKIFSLVTINIGIFVAAYLFIPVYFQCGVSTVYEFLEMRYGSKVRYTVSVLFVLQMVFVTTVALYAPVLALSAVTNLSLETSIVIIGLVCTFYCVMGGLRAVLWTDLLQAILMFTVVFLLFSYGVMDAGGIGEVYKKSLEGKRLDVWNFSPDLTIRYTVWCALVKGLVASIALYGTSQVEVQRMFSVRSLGRARSSLLWSTIPITILSSFCYLAGLAMYAIYYSCDPIKNVAHTGIKKYDQIVPYYLVNRFSIVPGLTGLCMSGLFSGALSTISSAINSMATVTVLDLLNPIFSTSKTSEKRTVFIAKTFCLFYGSLCIGLTFLLSKADSIIAAAITLTSIVEGPVLAIFLIAVLTRKGSDRCALGGLVVGIAITSWIGYGSLSSGYRSPSLPLSSSGCPQSNLTLICPRNSSCLSTFTPTLQTTSEPFILYRISFLWISTVGLLVSLLVTSLLIWVTGSENVIPADSMCLSPIRSFWKKHEPSLKNWEKPQTLPLKEKECMIQQKK